MKNKPNKIKVLIISNECLSNSTSNGRTIRNFFAKFEPGSVAQFYIQPGNPDKSITDNYYCVSDTDVLNSVLKKNKTNRDSTIAVIDNKPRKNAFTMLIRNFLWGIKTWDYESLIRWSKEFDPDIVFLQAGDCSFLFKLALSITKETNSKLVVYNCESYYFKKFDYFQSKMPYKMFYPLFSANLRKAYKELMHRTSYVIYNCQQLAEKYSKEFVEPKHHSIVYTSSEVTEMEYKTRQTGEIKISYLGNLGVGRHEPLIELSKLLHKKYNLKLDIYGASPSTEVKNKLLSEQGINYYGFVPYSQVLKVMEDSTILVHVENQTEYYKNDLAYSFSTKIADILSSGKCFLFYAPSNMAATQYLKDNNAAFIASTSKELENAVEQIMNDIGLVNCVRRNALQLSKNNHDLNKNASLFWNIINQVLDY